MPASFYCHLSPVLLDMHRGNFHHFSVDETLDTLSTFHFSLFTSYFSHQYPHPNALWKSMFKFDADDWYRSLLWALLSPLFLGLSPILAKVAYAWGADVYTVVAFRTLAAAGFLWVATLLFAPRLVRSSSIAVLSSLLAGSINGVGSLFYYQSLSLIDASLAQLLNITYLVFVTILLRLLGQNISKLTLGRMGLAILAVYLLTMGGLEPPNWWGVGLMLVGAFSYAVQLVLGERILRDIPAPTMTLYAMTGMAGVVTLAWLVVQPDLQMISAESWLVIGLLGLVTALSRLTLFLGVKGLGSLQAALLGVAEVLVSIALAVVLLGEELTAVQWLGAFLILLTVLLVKYERDVPSFDWWALLYRRWARK
jgi:drug/metabolite transporter (DMT)-like permease